MLSIYPGSDMTPIFHKYLFELGKHIHKKTQKNKKLRDQELMNVG